ncbi:MAG TPA: MFS transporter [Stellaceae bacterium]|nr:MFS transporter [Stellaceae bacterium]
MTDITANTTVRDLKTISMVSTVHGMSHFYQLTLPPLLPVLKVAFGVSYTDLGLLMSVFYICSGLAQTPAGFLVDRLGARSVLMGGLATYGIGIALIGFVPQYWMLLPCAGIAGIGNSVFHPADYSVLTANVTPGRMARAYSAHALSGNIGWVLAPMTVLGLTGVIGWQHALQVVGLFGVALAAWLALFGHLLDENTGRARHAKGGTTTPARALLTTPILMCFAYFIVVSIAGTSIQTFLPATLHNFSGVSLDFAGTVLTFYVIGVAGGIITGGIIADRKIRPDLIIAVSLMGAGVLILLVGLLSLPNSGLLAMMAAVGFCSGVSGPSRDLLVRQSSPPGATGKVFGFVYSGFDVGSAITPSILGFFLDRQTMIAVFVLPAIGYMLSIFTAVSLGAKRRPVAVVAVKPAEEPAE